MAKQPTWAASASDIEAVISGAHRNPFGLLGLHKSGKEWIVRAFVPGADLLEVQTLGGKALGELPRRHQAGYFEGVVKAAKQEPLRFHCRNGGGAWSVVDAYSFGPVLGPMDDYYIGEGNHLTVFILRIQKLQYADDFSFMVLHGDGQERD